MHQDPETLLIKIRELEARVSDLRHQVSTLREAGDDLWYAYRHKCDIAEAVDEWQEAKQSCHG